MSRNLPFAGLAAAVLALAACGVGPQQPASARHSVNPAQVYHQFAQCVRDHGRPDFPDPTVDAQGQPQLPDGVQRPSDQVMRACGSILNQLPPSTRGSGGQSPDPAMMRRFAQCLRSHGIDDWPDPNADGTFTFPPSLAGNLKAGPRWPQIRAAWDGPCKQYNTTGHIWASN